ncbi:MAG: YjgP/YjgQ family permease [Flavobacteriales bacterium]|nr:YjgP/YjgQ family permease [Flavobacteriales bacterium]NDC28657.1 YjgP/YjgQ family permease [Crocinitomicaceae bacterium]NDC93078.1 YjgP/YjgQ family permease [Flavobacteriales bacterium]
MFILILQFFWLYIDDLMGKGLGVFVILELLFYVSASLIPLALPLAILLSSLMTFGNLSENNELTALKSSGLSLYRIIRPLFVLVLLISFGTFYFANYIIPVANLKWHSLIYDIQNTKIATLLTPGVYSKEFDGFAIKVKKEENDVYYDMTIHDHTQTTQLRTVKAKEARVYKSLNGQYLFFKLKNGNIYEELDIQNPSFLPNGQINGNLDKGKPARISTFQSGTYKINLTGYSLNRSNEDVFTDKHEMMNVFQISKAMDSISLKKKNVEELFTAGLITDHILFNKVYRFDSLSGIPQKNEIPLVSWAKIPKTEKSKIIQQTISKLRNSNTRIENQLSHIKVLDNEAAQYWIEFHRKFALTYAIIVLFFVGAPLGAIIKKGGFGAPVVIATIIFMIYFILMSIGNNLANSHVVTPFLGMWMAGIFFTPIAFIITRAAANDSQIFNLEAWQIRLVKLIQKK